MEIHVIWSIASGKREIHFNKTLLYHDVVPNRGVQRFDHTFTIPEFTLPGGHIIHVTALSFAFNESEQFVISINGQNYEEFLNIYELGGARMHQIYGVLLENYARYRQGSTPLQIAAANQENVLDRHKYLPVPNEGKIKDAKNYSMLPSSKREEKKMLAKAMEQSMQDTSAMDRLHNSSLERLSSIRSYRRDEVEVQPIQAKPQAPQPVVDLLGMDFIPTQTPSVPRETPEQMLLSLQASYSNLTSDSASSILESRRREISASSSSSIGRNMPYAAPPPPTWETLQSDFNFASPPYNPSSDSKSYYRAF